MSKAEEPRTQDWLVTIGRERKRVSTALFVAAALFLLIPVLSYRWYGQEYIFVVVWGSFLALLALGGALAQLVREPGYGSDDDAARYLILALGGFAGLVTFLLGIELMIQWWDVAFAGGMDLWRKNLDKIGLSFLGQFGGLILMFLSLQAARGKERTNPTLRILLYGYNAFLSGLLLLYILAGVNLLTYADFQRLTVIGPLRTAVETPIDWTKGGQFSIKRETREALRKLNRDVKVFVIMSAMTPHKRDAEVLMNNFKAQTEHFSSETLSPDLDKERIKQLESNGYPVGAREGLLVVVGTKPKEQFDFIPLGELTTSRDRSRSTFSGEYQLIRRIQLLLQDKAKSIIYFTQGHGEPSNDGRGGVRLTTLRMALDQNNLETKDITIGGGTDKVPEDAGVLVMVRPKLAFTEGDVAILRNYMNNADGKGGKGRLLVFLEPVLDPDRKLIDLGLDSLLAEYNVQLGKDRILTLRSKDPTMVVGAPSPQNRTELAEEIKALFEEYRIPFPNARTVKPLQEAGPHGIGAKYQTEPLMETAIPDVWAETNFQADPVALAKDLIRPERREERAAKMSKTPLPFAVTVSESATDPTDKGKPRMVVFGSSDWVDDRALFFQNRETPYLRLFGSLLNWVQEKPDLGPLPKEEDQETYTLLVTGDTAWRMVFLPLILTLGCISGLGAGIWLARRR